MMTLLPAPVSPVKTLNAPPNSTEAFSIIHEKRFLSFRRNFHEENSGDSRIIDLLKNLGIEDRWVQNIEQSSTDLLINEIDYCDVKRRLEYLRMDSNGYLSKKLMDNK